MSIKEIEARMAEIKTEMEQPEADLEKLEEEVRSLNEERDMLKAEAEKAAEMRKKIAAGLGRTIDQQQTEEKRSIDEIRASKEYAEAYARYIATGNPAECRALTTENVSGNVPVPVLVDEIVRTAWEKNEILNRVRKTAFRGNLKVPFERSADPAYVHTEATTAPTEENLTLGIVTMIPANIKKWIHIPDEVIAMGGEPMLRYIYDELTYRIVLKLAELVVTDIAGLSTSNGATAVGAAKITKAPGLTVIPEAFANLSDEAQNPVIIMNKLTYAAFQEAYAAGNFAVDPFMGLPILYTSALPAYSTASTNDVYAIVGDLNGAQVNYPEGEGVVIKYNDLSRAKEDVVEVIGRQYAAHAVTAPFRFTNIAKPAAATT